MANNGMEPLADLSEEQRASVRQWLEEKVAHVQIATNLSEQHGVEASPAAVSRFAKRWKAEKMLEGLNEKRAIADRVLQAEAEAAAANGMPVDMARASMSVLLGRVFEDAMETSDPKAQRELLRLLSNSELQRERVSVARANHDLAREKFRFNAGRVVMKHWYALKDIHERRGEDDQAKIEKARDITFGVAAPLATFPDGATEGKDEMPGVAVALLAAPTDEKAFITEGTEITEGRIEGV